MLYKVLELLARLKRKKPDSGPRPTTDPPRRPQARPSGTQSGGPIALIRSGAAPAGMRVDRPLVMRNEQAPLSLPPGLRAPVLDLSDSKWLEALPADLNVTTLIAERCEKLATLPGDLRAYEVRARGSGLREVCQGIAVGYKLALGECRSLTTLPAGLRVGVLDLRGCTALEGLPEGLDVDFLELDGCTALTGWPASGSVRLGRLSLRGCAQVTELPAWIGPLSQLDLAGCSRIIALPESLQVSGWIDLAGTGITRLPAGCARAQLRWRGVPIDQRIAFSPDSITSAEILAETNAERRRVLLERCGYERFLGEAQASVRDRDTDPGGPRELLVLPMDGDEDLVCVSVRCPSTSRRYVIRVPPDTPTCRHAVAWIAGFDDPDEYRPLIET